MFKRKTTNAPPGEQEMMVNSAPEFYQTKNYVILFQHTQQ
jgi:hypothetical protein